MGLLLALLLLGHLTVVTYGLPMLEAPESVTGPWKGDVNIPCTYSSLQGYTQVLVKWLVQHGSDPVTIFLRDSSGDHIQRAKYRGRMHVNKEVPGDVSLQLKTLEMDDRSHYICEVTWQTSVGNSVVRDKSIELRVQKHSSKPLNTKTEASTILPTSLKATSTMNLSWSRTTEVDAYLGETSAGSVKGLPLFAIILIISLCCVVVFTMAYIMTCRKTLQQEHVYEVARMHTREARNCEETMRVAILASGCSSEEPDAQVLSNDYSNEPCLCQDYQIIAQINGDYARLLHTMPPNFDLLAMEGKRIC
ncbi:V-set and immunoglobulin domain-containing protein 4 isoform X4 [Tamandua tetradactyla]|uniref:V-set and immunoglobulin domain-containing protein 4 isoform X4 n=1 Tax=Tamandua tetradactyla TaxID=48850 RepID=UPI0040542E9E